MVYKPPLPKGGDVRACEDRGDICLSREERRQKSEERIEPKGNANAFALAFRFGGERGI